MYYENSKRQKDRQTDRQNSSQHALDDATKTTVTTTTLYQVKMFLNAIQILCFYFYSMPHNNFKRTFLNKKLREENWKGKKVA